MRKNLELVRAQTREGFTVWLALQVRALRLHVLACMLHALRGWPQDLHPWLPPAGGEHPWKPMRRTSVLDGTHVVRVGIQDSDVLQLQYISLLHRTMRSVSVHRTN